MRTDQRDDFESFVDPQRVRDGQHAQVAEVVFIGVDSFNARVVLQRRGQRDGILCPQALAVENGVRERRVVVPPVGPQGKGGRGGGGACQLVTAFSAPSRLPSKTACVSDVVPPLVQGGKIP